MFTELKRFLSRQNARKIGVVSIYSSAFSRLRLVVGFFHGGPNSSGLGSEYQKIRKRLVERIQLQPSVGIFGTHCEPRTGVGLGSRVA